MSLLIKKEPKSEPGIAIDNLDCGTWFIDDQGHICAVVSDPYIQQNRVVYFGQDYPPFIFNPDVQDWHIERVLLQGTMLSIETGVREGGVQ